MFCPSCGSQNPPEARHCISCGAQLPAAPAVAGSGATGEVNIAGQRLAGLGDRFIAIILDTIFLAAGFAAVGMWAAIRWGGVTESGFSLEGKPALITFCVTVGFAFLYYWLLEGIFGATLGKLLVGIQVRDKNGAACGLGASLIRNLLRLVDGIAVYLVGFLIAIFSKLRQRLGDRLANTVVVQSGAGGVVKGIALILWLAGIAGGVWGAYTIHRAAPGVPTTTGTVPESTASSSSAQTIAKTIGETLTLTSGEFKLSYAWREGSKDGPIRSAGPYAPGETVYLTYELSGYGATPDGGADLKLEFAPTDPSGASLYAPRTVSFAQSGTASGYYWFELHPYVQKGMHQLVVKTQDAVKNSESTFSLPFEVEAAPIAPATALEFRNFRYSTSKDGPAIDPAVFGPGQTVHYSFDMFGARFQGDRCNWQIAMQLSGPDGKVLLDRPEWDITNEEFAYHPPSFFIHFGGYLTLPSETAQGTYTLKLAATDKIANASLTHQAKFQVR